MPGTVNAAIYDLLAEKALMKRAISSKDEYDRKSRGADCHVSCRNC